ncbi:MAG: 2-succinyl-5-enolpyruvyl-6-hydroxy-3-cyclohexene-1-carboxylic-acid synthase [Acidobacteriota bacterium]
MIDAVVQTLWAQLIAASLADAGVRRCVVSPGSRSTPLVAALAADGRFDLPSIVDERAAAFFALGVARATGSPAAMVCTSGSAAAHYLPALVEASCAGVPLVAITADRPPELHDCGANQTIDQVKMYGAFVRATRDLGAPVGSALALRAVRRKVLEAVGLARGPHAGPVHLEVPLRKPLEPAAPATDDERALAREVAELRASTAIAPPPRLHADDGALAELAAAIAAEPRGVVIAGALPVGFPRDGVLALCARAGYPLLAEAASQLRFGPRPAQVAAIDHFDLVLASPALAGAPAPRLVIQLGAEPVAAAWTGTRLPGAQRWVLAARGWHDPEGTARGVIVGDPADALARLAARVEPTGDRASFPGAWRGIEQRIAGAIDRALAAHPRCEGAVLRAALDAAPAGTLVQLGNSLPIRVVDHACSGGGAARGVLAQRGAAGIDGLIASAAGATRAGAPVLLVLGDVSFAHDLGGLLAAREASSPLAIVVVDNAGGRIFSGLPVARANLGAAFERHWLTPPAIDPAAVAAVLGAHAITAATPQAAGEAVAAALATSGTTVIHAPVTPTGAHDLRRHALELAATGGATHA